MAPRLPNRLAVALVAAGLAAAVGLGYLAAERPATLLQFIVAGLALALVLLVWRRPDIGLLGLAVLLPFYATIFGQLLIWGVPISMLSAGRFWKEVVLLTLSLKLLTKSGTPKSRTDAVMFAFLGLTALFAIAPIGPSLYPRLLGAREAAAYVVIFLAARHVPLDPRFGRRLTASLLLTGTVLSLLAVWDHFAHASWETWVTKSGLQVYNSFVLGSVYIPGAEVGHIGNQVFIRAGALFLNPLSLAIYLLVPVGIAVGAWVTGRARRWELACGMICAIGLLMTLTRSAIAMVPLVVTIALVVGRQRSRVSLGLVLAAGALWPIATVVGLGDHLSDALNPNSLSTQGHLGALLHDLPLILSHPLGLGLATAGGLGQQRLGLSGAITAESWYFQVGLELGVIGLVLFVWFQWLVIAELGRRARAAPLAMEAFCAMVGISIIGVVMHTLGDQVTAYSLWMLAGAALAGVPGLVSATPAPARAWLEPVARAQPQ